MKKPKFERCLAPVAACPFFPMMKKIRELEVALKAVRDRIAPTGDPDVDAARDEREMLLAVQSIATSALEDRP
jgi:hypothetical protein